MTQPELPTDRPKSFGEQEKPPRIAFVVDWLEDSYQTTVLAGAAEVARERGVTLVALLGGVIGASHGHGQRRNKLYDLLTPDSYDGVIVMTGTIANAHGVDVMERLCPDFPKSRVCNIAIEVPGSPSVLIDNTRGMRRLVEHMIRVHGHRRIAFVRGPESNPEAEARFAAYRDVLASHHIPLDPELVVQGDFLREAGARAVQTLLDDRKISVEHIDAIIAADDLMALATLDELCSRNISVPGDIAVAGFDDVEEARYATPPLSSVRQPLLEQGREAMQLVLAALSSTSSPPPLVLDTSCCFRRSCGCTVEDPGFLTERPKVDSRLSLVASVQRRRDLILAEISRTAHGSFSLPDPRWAEFLFDALVDTFNGREGALRKAWDSLLHEIIETGGEVAAGQSLLSALRRQLSVCAGDDPSQIRQMESVLHDARVLTSDAVERAQARRRIQTEQALRVLTDVSFHMCNANNATPLNDLIAIHLPRLGVKTCYVSRPFRGTSTNAELIAALKDGLQCPTSLHAQFLATDLVPEGHLLPGECLVVEPLCDDRHQYGFAVFRLGELDGFMYEVVRRLVTVAVSRQTPLRGPPDSNP